MEITKQPKLSSRFIFSLVGLPFLVISQAIVLFRVIGILEFGMLGNKQKDWIFSAITNVASPAFILAICVVLFTVGPLVFLAYIRAKRLGWSKPWLFAVLCATPFLGIGIGIWLAMVSDPEKEEVQDIASIAAKLIAPAAICWAFIIILGILATEWTHDRQGYLGLSLFILLPFITTGIVGHLAAEAKLSYGNALGAAWTTLSSVLLILGCTLMEGVVCVFMAMPFGFILGFLGGTTGYFLGKYFRTSNRQVQAVGWLSVLLCGISEANLQIEPFMGDASSSIVVHAPPEKVWAQLHDIHNLPPTQNLLFILGVAHPLESFTEKGGGIGAQRVCRLSTGDMTEIINVWRPNEELRFDVLETPASMREAAFFGQTIDTAHIHNTYKSLEGGFRLVRQPNGDTLLIGESRYLLNLAPAGYWNLWTEYIVHCIQRSVLEHIKTEAEKVN